MLYRFYCPARVNLSWQYGSCEEQNGEDQRLTKVTEFEDILRADEEVLRLDIWKTDKCKRPDEHDLVALLLLKISYLFSEKHNDNEILEQISGTGC